MTEVRFRIPDHLRDEAAQFGLSLEDVAREAIGKAIDKARAEHARRNPWLAGHTILGPVNQAHNPAMRTVGDVAEVLGLGKSAVFNLLRTGELRSVKIGGRRLIPVKCLDEFVTALEERAE